MNKLYLACMCTVMASMFPVSRVGADGGDFQRDFAEEMRLRGCYPITETGQRWGDLGTGGPVSFSIKYDNDGYSLDYEALNVISCEHWMDWNPRIYINVRVVDWKLEREASVNGDGIDAFQNLNGLSKSDGRHRV